MWTNQKDILSQGEAPTLAHQLRLALFNLPEIGGDAPEEIPLEQAALLACRFYGTLGNDVLAGLPFMECQHSLGLPICVYTLERPELRPTNPLSVGIFSRENLSVKELFKEHHVITVLHMQGHYRPLLPIPQKENTPNPSML